MPALLDEVTGMKIGFVILTIILIAVSGAFYGLDNNEKYTDNGEFTTKGKALVWTSWCLLSIWLFWVMILVAKGKPAGGN